MFKQPWFAMPALSFKLLRFTFSLLTSALLAWIAAATFDVKIVYAFLVFAVGLPVIAWLDRIKNLPAYIGAAAILNKQLVGEMKRTLKRLPLHTAEEWNEFEAFYDSDDEIARYRATEPKAAAAIVRSEVATLKSAGLMASAILTGWIVTRATDELWQKQSAKEQEAGAVRE